MSRGPRRSRRRVLLFSLAAVTVLLLLGEGGARLLLLARYGPLELPALPGAVRLPPKEADTFRLLVLGGSTVYGEPLPRAGFVQQLRGLLAARFPETRLEVWNLGQPGMDSSRVLATLVRALESEPDAVVVYTGHNEFLRSEVGYGLWPRLRERIERLGTAVLLRTLKDRLAARGLWPAGGSGPAVSRDSPFFARKEQRFRENLDAMVRETARAGVPLVLCTAACNLADWPPVGAGEPGPGPPSEASPEAPPPPDAGPLGAAGPAGSASQGGDAATHFRQGKQAAAQGRYAEAARRFDLAREEDPVPWRVLDTFNRTIRARAGQEGVVLADMDRAFRENSPHGLVGFSLFLDNCHPTPRGNFLAAVTLLGTLETHRVPARLWTEEPGPGTGEVVRAYPGDGGLTRQERVTLLLRSGIYCMKPPFHHREAARRWFRQARELDPENWEVWANLAAVSLAAGERERGRRELDRAMRLKDAPFTARDWGKAPYLKQALGTDRSAVPP